ncbi:transfer protein spdA [Streptomyces cellulosae]
MRKFSVTGLFRYAALGAAMVISFATQRELALSHGVPVAVSPAVPLAVDFYLIWAVRSGRDVGLAVSVAMAANVAGVLTAEPLSAVGTWVAAGLHAVFPLTIWRMHRSEGTQRPSEGLPPASPANESGEAVNDSQSAAEADLWTDFDLAEADSADTPSATPPSPADIRAAVSVLASKHDRVTGRVLADHFGVSERTGRRYLSMIGG